MASTSTQARRVPSGAGKAQPGAALAKLLLTWYDLHRRVLPWRAPSGTPADPYRVLLRGIMLQQTAVVAVVAYFKEVLARWPGLASLAAAGLDAVRRAWPGRGY